LLVVLAVGLLFLALQPTPELSPGVEILQALVIAEVLFAVPLWVLARVIDFMIGGPIHRWPSR
jgi:hypothetical protein